MILKLEGIINDAMFDRLIEFYNLYSERDNIIYLKSGGGETRVANAMLDLINTHRKSTILKGYSHLYSSAFELFFSVSCRRELINGCMGMYHLYGVEIRYNSLGNPDYIEGDTALLDIKASHTSTLAFGETMKFTKKEYAKLKKGGDVYFQADRMREFLTITNRLDDIAKHYASPT